MSNNLMKRVICLGLVTAVVIVLAPGAMASARSLAATSTQVLHPVSIVDTAGTHSGTPSRLTLKDQSGTADNPTKYVLFKTPGVNYEGYRTYSLPGTISAGAVTQIDISANYSGPAKGSQAWSWRLYDWVAEQWVQVGDNTGAKANIWKLLAFAPVTDNPSRFVNNASGEIRLELMSSNAGGNAKLDYELITVTYEACTDTLGCVYIGPSDPVHIAYHLGIPNLRSLEGAGVAVDEWTSGGGILGHTIQFDGVSHSTCDSTVAEADALEAIQDASILALLGPSCSAEAREMIPVITGAGLSMVSPSNTLPELTDTGTPGYFRAAWNDLRQAELAAEYAFEIGSGPGASAAIIRDESGYSISLGDAFAAKFTNLAGSITAQVDITSDQTDMLDLLDGIAVSDAGGPPDFLYLSVSMPAGSYIINQAKAMPEFQTAHLLGPDSLFDRMLMLSTGSDSEGFLLTGPDDTQFAAAYTSSFLPAYFAKYAEYPDGLFAPYGYDTFNIIAVAIEAAATDLGGGAHLVGRQALRDALFATDYAGLTDTFSCEDNGDCSPSPALGVFEVHKNEWGPTHVYPIP